MVRSTAFDSRRVQRAMLTLVVLFTLVVPALPAGAVVYDLSGRVTDSGTAAGIPDVTVVLYMDDGQGSFDEIDQVSTDADGYYHYATLPGDGDYLLEFYAEGYEYADAEFTFSGSPVVRDAALDEKTVVGGGKVTDWSTDDPIADAWIYATYTDGGEEYEMGYASSDEYGNFTLYDEYDSGARSLTVRVYAEGYEAATFNRSWDGFNPLDLDAALRPAKIAFAGKITDSATGKAIADAWIGAEFVDGEDTLEAGSAFSDSVGHYDLYDVFARGAGDYVLYVEAEGYEGVVDEVAWGGGAALTRNYALEVESNEVEAVPVEGANRYETAVKGSRLAFPDDGECNNVVIASGTNFPDALGGSALAGALGCPVLLTDPAAVSAVVLGEIDRLGATDAWIVGGTAAVSDNVLNSLRARGLTCTRIAGADRYQTAAKVAEKTVDLLGPGFGGEVMFATGENFPDALAAAPLASWTGAPILLVTKTGVPAATAAALETIDPVSGVILGGDGVIGATPTALLRTRFGSSLKRLAGSDRYATAKAIAEYGAEEYGLSWDGIAFATGENFPDALAGGTIQGLTGSVVLLTRGTVLSPPASAAIEDHGEMMYEVRFFGGKNAIADTVRSQIMSG